MPLLAHPQTPVGSPTTHTLQAWQRNWGFLVEGQAGQESAPDSLSAFMKQAKQGNMSYIAGRQRESARNRRLEQQDSLDGFMRTAQTRKLPAEEFRKPLTTSQDYGWGRSLERFGAMQLVMK